MGALLANLRAGHSAALVLSGEAGIGKTELLRHTVREAGEMRVAAVSGYESEVQIGFAALHRLAHDLFREHSRLPVPQREALAVTFGLEPGPAPNRFLVGLGMTTLLASAARAHPLLCTVDDAQWVDQETMDTLAFVARRLDSENVGLVFALRSSGSLPHVLGGIPEHRLAPMSEQEMRTLLAAAGATAPAAHVAARLIEESDGNPLALLEYVASLSPERLAGRQELPPALPVGERLARGFVTQVARMPDATRKMLLVLSAAGVDDADAVPEIGRRLGIGPNAWTPALRASILSARPRLMFRHPLIRSVVYAEADRAARQQVHAALADVAQQHGFLDTAAWHRAHATSGPDDDVARQLEEAAAHARARGGYAAEAALLTLATRRSTAGTDGHSRRLLAAAHAHIIAGHGTQAEHLLDVPDPGGVLAARIEAARIEAILLSNDPRHASAAARLVQAAAALPAEHVELARELLLAGLRTVVGSRALTIDTSVTEVSQALLHRPYPPGREPAAGDLIYEGIATRFVHGYVRAAPVLKHALAAISRSQDFAAAQSALLLTWLAMEDLWDDEFESTTWTRITDANRTRGALPSVWVGIASSATTEARHGNFDTANAMFDEAVALSVAVGAHPQVSWSVLIEFRAWQGRDAETRSMADTLIREWSGRRRYGSSTNFALTGLTVIELGSGNYAEAFKCASQVARDDPPGHGSRILPDLIEAAMRSGEQRAAELALDDLSARATAAGTSWALGVLARSRAVALGRSPEAEPHYEHALSVLTETRLRIEAARTHLLYGEWLRRRKRRTDARTHLNAANSAFTEMGARLFADRAAAELAALGGLPNVTRPTPITTPPSELTAQERRVAELAAQGLTNAEISQHLFISDSTVDYHLSKVFRKLQITSRRRLREALKG